MGSEDNMKIKTTLSAPATWTKVGELMKISGPVIKPGIYKGLGQIRIRFSAPVLDRANSGLLRQTVNLFHKNKDGRPIGFCSAVSTDHKVEEIIYSRAGEQAVLSGDVKMHSIEAEVDGKKVQNDKYDYDAATVNYTSICLVEEGDVEGAYIESIGTVMMEKMEESIMETTETIEVEIKAPTVEDIKESETFKVLQAELEKVNEKLDETNKALSVYREAELKGLKETIKGSDPEFNAEVFLEGITDHEHRKRILVKLADLSTKAEDDKAPTVELGVATPETPEVPADKSDVQKSIEAILGEHAAKEYLPYLKEE